MRSIPAWPAAAAGLVLLTFQEGGAQVTGFDQEALIADFVAFDNSRNEGRAYSDQKTSSALAWGESYYLNAYIKMYLVTGDPHWLDKVVDHFDRMAANMSDHDGDGIPGWQADRYSVSRMRAEALHNRGTARILPAAEVETNIQQAHEAVDAEYIVERTGEDRFTVRQRSSVPWQVVRERTGEDRFTVRQLSGGPWEVVHDGPHAEGEPIPGIAGFEVRLEGRPEIGDRFRVETWGPAPLEYAVHEGMILYPVAQLIELALKDPRLQGRYEEKARSYLQLIEERVLEKQERHWQEVGPGMGAYRFTESPSERFPNRVMPHNQYLALARVWLVLKDVSDNPLYLERATQMAAHFRHFLEKTGSAWTWNYWDWTEAGEPDHSRPEDTSHGQIDVTFAVEAFRRGVVFTKEDMLRFTRTFTDQMWNGSLEEPRIGGRVDGPDGDSKIIRGWMELCRWDPRIWEIQWARFNRLERPGLDIPHILYGRALLDGEVE